MGGTATGLTGAEIDSLFGESAKTLKAKDRNRLSKPSFAIPETRSYPIHDLAHARNALARVAQHGTPDEKKRVRAAVYRKFPQLKSGGK